MENSTVQNPAILPITNEYRQIQQQMKDFQDQVGSLRAMAHKAQEETLKAIRESVLQQGANTLQQLATINDQTDSEMAKRTTKSSKPAEAEIIDNAAQASEYTDLQMARIIDNMKNQVASAMKAADKATYEGSNAIEQAIKQSEQLMAAQPKQGNEGAEQQAKTSMEEAQKTVASSLEVKIPGINE